MVQSIRQRAGKLAATVVASTGLVVAMIGLTPGPALADVATFSNTTAIAVPAAGSPNGLGSASPYPSSITVSGMSGTVTDVDVTLSNLSHPIASDLDVLVVGPAGQSLLLMSDVKGDTGFPVSGTITFDDQAASAIPSTGALGTGTYQPTDRADSNGPDTFPAPAPAPSGVTLGQFNGTNPNGSWRLFAVDDASGDVGVINGGWSITITTGAVAQPGSIEFTSASYRGAEGGGPVSLTLSRVGGSDGAVGVTIATTTPATATAGTDFAPLSLTVSFAAGQVTASVPLTILNDTVVEGVDETVTVALSSPTGGAALGARTTAVVTIDDNDATFDTTPITIPAIGTGGSTGSPAAPYPASIHVSGQPTSIGGVEIALNGFTHQVPIDVDLLLVGPSGQNVVLMSDVGGPNGVTGLNLTFSDAAAGTIPAAGPLTSGTYRPSDDDSGGSDAFPAPAPAPSTATSLAGFVGTNPNGVWNLFAVDDASGDVGSISGGWSLTFLPVPPVADAGGPYTVAEGGSLTLDGSGSSAPSGATYAWDLDGDGQFDDATGAAPTVAAAQLQADGLGDGPAGPATISLRVTSGTQTATDTATLSVTNVAPTASAPTVPSGIVAGTPASVTFGATDPSAADEAAGFTYAIDWGDGGAMQSFTGGGTATVSHTWAAAGSFTVSVTATDKDAGTSAPATATAVVASLVVADAGGPYSVAEGDAVTLDASGSTAGPTAVYAWDLDGDGQFDDAVGQTVTLTPEQLAVVGLDDGPKGPVTLTVQITDGLTVATDTASYTIGNVAPTATVEFPSGVVAGTPATFKVGAVDPSPTDAAGQFEYRIDWDGDGTVDAVVSGPADPPVTHTYVAGGTFGLTVVAVDKDGAAGAPTVTAVTVGAAPGPAPTPTPTPTPKPLPPTGGDAGPLALLAAMAVLLAAVGAFATLRGRRPGRAERRG